LNAKRTKSELFSTYSEPLANLFLIWFLLKKAAKMPLLRYVFLIFFIPCPVLCGNTKTTAKPPLK
jgi:hypothetical protein